VRLAVEATTTGHEAFWISAPDPRVPVGETVGMLIDKYYASVPGADEARRRDSLMNCDKAERVLGWRATRVIRDERARRGLIACP
jgi:nucleoside-diphosphate-sugar epimerase